MDEPEHQDHYKQMAVHLVMPRNLPQERTKNFHDFEINLSHLMTDKVSRLTWLPQNTREMMRGVNRVHNVIPEDRADIVALQIAKLKPGNTFGMFIRRQNCGLMIHVPPNEPENPENVIVSTFPANLHPRTVYDCKSDLELTFPTQALRVKFSEILRLDDFITHLCWLYSNLSINTKNRNYVSKWLVTMLCDENARALSHQEYPSITKKLRDEVVGESKQDFFRRSSFYMCIKVFLQQSLTVDLGAVAGKAVYKLAMLHFLTEICKSLNESRNEPFDIDLMTQFIAKLARRIEKLEAIDDNQSSAMKESVVSSACRTIRIVRKKIDKKIQKLQKSQLECSQLDPIRNLNFEEDMLQKVPKLLQHLEKRSSVHVPIKPDLNVKSYRRHYRGSANAPPIEAFKSTNGIMDRCLILADLENWILYDLDSNETRFSPEEIHKWATYYAQTAENFYQNDQLGISKMLLVRLKLIAILDRLITTNHPMLLEHRSSVDPNLIAILLLPQHIDMRIAFELETYFSLRNTEAYLPGLTEERNATPSSFSVRFAERTPTMQTLLGTIQAIDDLNIKERRKLWENLRKEVAALQEEIVDKSHETYRTRGPRGRVVHPKRCLVCTTEKKIAGFKMAEYRKLLPNDTWKQYAIAFELEIPVEVACLRDLLAELSCFCVGSENKTISIQRDWKDEKDLSTFNRPKGNKVTLGSSTNKQPNDLHVNEDFNRFVVSNGSDCIYHLSGNALSQMTVKSVKKSCTLSTEKKYSCLQWTVETTSHTQNQLLARQSECPQDLLLNEFKNFGSLRADGHRLQLRKLYAMIECEALSFAEPSVVSLVAQVLWEAGVRGGEEPIRESFIDFKDQQFTGAFIELLDTFIEQQKNNWMHSLKLLSAVLVIIRIFELNDDEALANKIVCILHKVRLIALNWIEKIKKFIQKMDRSIVNDIQNLRWQLVLVAIMGAITFFVHPQHKFFDKILENNTVILLSAASIWIQFVVVMNNNTVLGSSSTKTQLNLELFQRLVWKVGIGVEQKIRERFEETPNECIELIKFFWPRAKKGIVTRTEFHAECPQVLVAYVQMRDGMEYATLDLITGSFKVNNSPLSQLPEEITNTKQYQRVFQQFVFEVQSEAQNSFSTVHPYYGCVYEFRTIPELVITERRGHVERELIPTGVLKGEIPKLLETNYSHWWNKNEGIIEFRPTHFSDEHFSDEKGIEYILHLDTRLLAEKKTEHCLLDITSPSYRSITRNLSRLEVPKYIHVSIDGSTVAKVELIRMRLRFSVDGSQRAGVKSDDGYDIVSNEFNNMRVSLEQNCGSLFGLRHGLLLESVPDASAPSAKLLLMPHGNVAIERKKSHVSVRVRVESTLYKPLFHEYYIDEHSRQIKANTSIFSAWFYLAYLHAVTSHGEAEPLTGMSGTERALQILQSGLVWSSAPYDEDATRILVEIAKLSPIRKQGQVEFMQTVEWPRMIPPQSAQDSYAIIAQKLFVDSERLAGLHKTNKRYDNSPNLKFNKREYRRCLALSPNMRVTEEFVRHRKLKTTSPELSNEKFSSETLRVSTLCHRGTFNVPSRLNLMGELLNTSELDGNIHGDLIPDILKHCVTISFKNLWLSLYEFARGSQMCSKKFAFVLSLLAHENNSIDLILVLQAISMNPTHFASVNPPAAEKFKLHEKQFDENKIRNTLERHKKYRNGEQLVQQNHDRLVELECVRLVAYIKGSYPCDEIELTSSSIAHLLNFEAANREINRLLRSWNNNRKLRLFLETLEYKLRELSYRNTGNIPLPDLTSRRVSAAKCWERYEIDIDVRLHKRLNLFKNDLDEAKQVWESEKRDATRSADEWWSLYERIIDASKVQHLVDSGLAPRVVPSKILPKITSEAIDPRLKALFGALAIETTKEQRRRRLRMASSDAEMIENEPHVNWRPCEYPNWLLFEIEQNVTIRRIQIEIAKRMINPPDKTKHSVMQLNMGEGKTAVIVPILASFLSNGSQVCQITVLKPLFATNLKSLRKYLGGMIGRKVYIFPCRRDLPIPEYIDEILKIYEECKANKGVILTLPEYRLSFQLMIHNFIHRGEFDTARKLLTANKWINGNARNILDESDAILNPKYQLIYTVGNQIPPDGGELRWLVVQALLKRVPHHMKELQAELGEQAVQFDHEYLRNGSIFGASKVEYRADVFTPCRILDESVFPRLKSALIDDFLEGLLDIEFPETDVFIKNKLKIVLGEDQINADMFKMTLRELSTTGRNIVLILCGYLRFEVLRLALMKLWRVNYGVDEKGHRFMAIPFKAKDVPTEMTEFGHSDVALCLTQLSYYYSGLSDAQLHRVFQIMSEIQNANAIYEKWICNIPREIVDVSILSFKTINLNDSNQREKHLFPIFRFNMDIIDFWLARVVFSREAKGFEKKLVCTSWDLCSDRLEHLVTGFSGTNDTKDILPIPITQNDLEELRNTNDKVERTLLRSENRFYEALPANVSGRTILNELVAKGIPILLDSGALMLELNNQQVAEEWLRLSPRYDAAVYFDKHDVLQTVDRNGTITEFECSSYHQNLERCLVYLDDSHTRGTDLKFPLETKACVTLAGDITWDKTVQSCMRMRKLGQGHAIMFLASFEADANIRKFNRLSRSGWIANEHIITFIKRNSQTLEEDNIAHWSSAALNYTRKSIAHILYEESTDENSLKKLCERCLENDYLSLNEIYGNCRKEHLSGIVMGRFSKMIQSTTNSLTKFIVDIQGVVTCRMMEKAPQQIRFTSEMDEEHEKELEQEIEEEYQIERPKPTDPVEPGFEERLEQLIQTGLDTDIFEALKTENIIMSIEQSLKNAQLFKEYMNESAWAKHLFVTRDFAQVIKCDSFDCDDYLRPVWWIARIESNDRSYILLLLSSFKCERLVAAFRQSTKAILYMYHPRIIKMHSDLLHEPRLRISAMANSKPLGIVDEIQIGVYSGSMYFESGTEQDEYCRFLGLIPRPRTSELQTAFQRKIISTNGFVERHNRYSSDAIVNAVGGSNFEANPTELAIKLIEAHHQYISNGSHVSSILKRGLKMEIEPQAKKKCISSVFRG